MARNCGHEPTLDSGCLPSKLSKINMADKKTKRSNRVDYNQLHHMSSELLYEIKPKKVKTYPKTFQVERIIIRRTVNKVS